MGDLINKKVSDPHKHKSLMHTSATHVAGRFGIVQLERYNSARVAIFQTDLQRGVAEVVLMRQT